MVIRDRLAALIYRLLALALGIVTLVLSVSTNSTSSIWDGLANYSTLVTFLGVSVLLSEIIANLIGITKNRKTLAPGIIPFIFHAALVLEIGLAFIHPFYCHFMAIAYFDSKILIYVFLTYIIFPLVILLDWLLYGEKGTVRWSYGMFPLFFPIFYYLFSLMWNLILDPGTYSLQIFNPNTFLVSTNLPEFFKNGDGWAGVFISCAVILGVIAALDYLIIFTNNLLAGRYSKRKKGY